ncbi:MAG: sensor histidine kinase [Candidatus Scalinduaceae bacterium]
MLNHKLHDLNNIIKSALIFMEYRIKTEHISLRKKFTPNIPKVRVNADDIFLVIVNLLTNAFDSMPNGGKLSIESKCYLGRDTCVQFSISDTGCGIEKNEIDKIYNPFFTIKAGRERNGLGLTICKTIIENHCGKIKVVSSLGKGTTFTVCFPARQIIMLN